MTDEPRTKQTDEIFCPSCAAIIKREAEICVKCGVRVRAGGRSGYRGQATSHVGSDISAGATGGTNDWIVQKLKDLVLGSQIILVAAVVLFIDSVLPWYSYSGSLGSFGGVDLGSVSRNVNGWESPGAMWSILAVLIALAMGGVTVARAFLAAGTIPDNVGGFTWPKIYLGASGVAVLFLLIKLINHSGDIAFGFFLGIICVAAMCAGSFLLYQDEQKGTAA